MKAVRDADGTTVTSIVNTPGTVDAGYRGEIKVPLINHGSERFTVEPEMRIAQMVIAPVVQAEVVEVDSLDETDRGSGGFGSTGTLAGSCVPIKQVQRLNHCIVA